MTTATLRWTTPIGLEVTRHTRTLDPAEAESRLAALERTLDRRRGLLMSGRSEQPGRYRPHDLGYTDPPVELTAREGELDVRSLNARGEVLLRALHGALAPHFALAPQGPDRFTVAVPEPEGVIAEEDRTRRPSVFTVLRAVVAAFAGPEDSALGLYGAFGYDLILGFDPVPRHQKRDPRDRTMVLHLPDCVLDIDRHSGSAIRHAYEFTFAGRTTAGLPRDTAAAPAGPGVDPAVYRDHAPGEYAGLVRQAQQHFRAGEMFEVVPGQSFHRAALAPPSAVFRRLRDRNPAPYGLLANLGDGEHLVGASPEMFVRVDAERGTVESCPISGTIARGADPLEDADRIKETALLREGGVGTDDVHRRGPQRQGPGLPSRQRRGAGPPPDRDVLHPHPHRRPRTRPAAARTGRPGRLPHPCLGGHRRGRPSAPRSPSSSGTSAAPAAGTAARSAGSASTAAWRRP